MPFTPHQYDSLLNLLHMVVYNVIRDKDCADLTYFVLENALRGLYNMDKEVKICTDDGDTTPAA